MVCSRRTTAVRIKWSYDILASQCSTRSYSFRFPTLPPLILNSIHCGFLAARVQDAISCGALRLCACLCPCACILYVVAYAHRVSPAQSIIESTIDWFRVIPFLVTILMGSISVFTSVSWILVACCECTMSLWNSTLFVHVHLSMCVFQCLGAQDRSENIGHQMNSQLVVSFYSSQLYRILFSGFWPFVWLYSIPPWFLYRSSQQHQSIQMCFTWGHRHAVWNSVCILILKHTPGSTYFGN